MPDIHPKFVRMYMDIAKRIARESHAVRLKVGAVFVSLDGVMSTGINGLPAGGSNECEIKEYFDDSSLPTLDTDNWPFIDNTGRRYKLTTKSEVSHAEENLFQKLMVAGVSTKGGIILITHAPCIQCSKIIVGSGVTHVYYNNAYRNTYGIEWLVANGIKVTQVE